MTRTDKRLKHGSNNCASEIDSKSLSAPSYFSRTIVYALLRDLNRTDRDSDGHDMTAGAILIVENDESLGLVMQFELKKLGYETSVVADAEHAIEILKQSHHALVITDLQLPGMSGPEMVKRIQIDSPETPVIVITSFGTVESAVDAMKAGAYDYLTKPMHLSDFNASVQCALNRHTRIEQPHQSYDGVDQDEFEQVIGSSDSLRRALGIAARVAPTDATVLILGETGTGKELVAKAIHQRSSRRERAFVTVSCGSIPKELLESELFGYTKGSFTGAIGHKKGKVELADRGTLFLDEIGEMPLALQVGILRLLQEREIEKIGATKPIKVDVRIIAATHRYLEAMVEEGSFREDLYYRLLVVPIQLPPLRERAGDILQLVHHFFHKYKLKYGRSDLVLQPELLSYFSNYQWPGNVRQLENSIERIVLLSGNSEVTPDVLPEYLKQTYLSGEFLPVNLPDAGLDVEAVEQQLIVRALQKFGGNQTRAAQFLNMSRRAFSYRLKKHGLNTKLPRIAGRVAGSFGRTFIVP
jgi:DNA-binding NtrC family response regulator